MAADNGYTKALRIRHWAKQDIILLTPATKWVKGRFAQAYHRFIKEADNQAMYLICGLCFPESYAHPLFNY